MKHFHSLLLPALLALLLPSCLTHVSVKKVTPGTNPRGFRYFLPQPVIVGTPKPDGSVTYAVDYYADPDHEYAVNAWSFMATHTVNLTRNDRGLLTKAQVDQDTTGVLSQLVKSAGSVGQNLETAVGAEKTARATAAATAASTVAAKKLAYDQAQAAVDSAQNTLDNATTDAAKATATTALTAAKLQREQARLAWAAAESAAKGNMDAPTQNRAYGPVVYAVVQKKGQPLRLEPMKFILDKSQHGVVQGRFATSTKTAAAAGGGGGAGAPAGAPNLPKVPEITAAKLSFEQKVAVPFESIIATQCVLKKKKGNENDWEVVSQFAKTPVADAPNKTVTISVQKDTPAGDYMQTVVFKPKTGQNFSNNYPFKVK